MLFLILAGIYCPLMQFIEMKNSDIIHYMEPGFFNSAVFLPILLSVFCSLFVGREYSDGTIRNKIMIGRTRTSIYLANLLTNIFAGLLLFAAFSVPYLCVGIPLLGFFRIGIKMVLCYTLVILMLTFAFTAIFTMTAMISASKATTAIICILSVFLLLVTGIYLGGRLGEPKEYNGYVISEEGEEPHIESMVNPHYLEGTEREIYQFLYDSMPGGQIVQCVSMEAIHLYRMPLYSAIIFILTTTAGIFVFRKKDIK